MTRGDVHVRTAKGGKEGEMKTERWERGYEKRGKRGKKKGRKVNILVLHVFEDPRVIRAGQHA